MSEGSKKNQQKGKSEAKDQRKRRNRQHAAPSEKKVEKKPEQPKVTVSESKPAYEPPPPEFYQNLKRETDEILKITEEVNSKYRKKEIQSNWAKYEMPIESYEDIDEQENLGADYEALSQAPLTVGGHFQFKHEKSWDISTGPSPYDKYFDINMDNLSIALSTIPFYERNSIDTSFFNETDIQSMIHRAAKYKHKYYNDKMFATPEIEAQDKIIDSLKSKDNVELQISESIADNEKNLNQFKDIKIEECEEPVMIASNINEHEQKTTTKEYSYIRNEENKVTIETNVSTKTAEPLDQSYETKNLTCVVEEKENFKVAQLSNNSDDNKLIDIGEFVDNEVVKTKIKDELKLENNLIVINQVDIMPKEEESHKEISSEKQSSVTNNPIIESPEDLEKWLDDFLDG